MGKYDGVMRGWGRWSDGRISLYLSTSPLLDSSKRHGIISGIRVGRQSCIADSEYKRLLKRGLEGNLGE